VIALVDYGAGNLTSVRKALTALDAPFWTPAAPAELAQASGIIVPGVGHFSTTASLDHGWKDAIRASLARGVPLAGICVGLQWLFEGSSEAPAVPGLGVMPGMCALLESPEPNVASSQPRLKVPHVGWNSLSLPRPSRLFDGVRDGTQVYFTHSYAAPIVEATAAVTTHGVRFSAAVEAGLVAGVQFHPEKSGDAGLRILRNWLTSVPELRS
jgi:imidazole glycerol-phosphate synthase subunit HisH